MVGVWREGAVDDGVVDTLVDEVEDINVVMVDGFEVEEGVDDDVVEEMVLEGGLLDDSEVEDGAVEEVALDDRVDEDGLVDET